MAFHGGYAHLNCRPSSEHLSSEGNLGSVIFKACKIEIENTIKMVKVNEISELKTAGT